MKKGLTFIELLIVAALMAVLTVVGIIFFDPVKQMQKSWDGKRISELNTLQKVFEDFYNDKNRFPLPPDVCFDSASAPRIDIYGKTACYCQICGHSLQSPQNFSPYLSALPCDPQSSKKEYLYDYDCSTTSPGWFRIYTKLSYTENPIIIQVGCGAGCGPSPDFAYNYAAFSNTKPETINCSAYTRLYQKDNSGDCNICKSPSGGDICNYDKYLYYNSPCTIKCSP